MEAIKQEGYNFCEPDHRSRVIGSALVGSTIYLAVKYDSESLHCVYGAVILTAYNKNRREFLTKGMSESMVPCSYDCPKRILDMLTPAEDECAKEWRRMCKEHRGKNRADALTKCEIGTLVKRKDNGVVLEAYKHRKRKVFVDWNTRKYNTAQQLRKIGYEIME